MLRPTAMLLFRSDGIRRALGRPLALVCALLLVSACSDDSIDLKEIHELQIKGNFAASIEPLRELLKERPEDSELHFLYGIALARTGQASLAIWSLREASKDPKWFVHASLELARSAISARDFPAAIESAGAVLEREPDHVAALRLRGQALLEDKVEAEAALEDLTRAVGLDPDDMPTRLTQLRAMLALSRVEEAETAFAEIERRAAEGNLQEEDVALVCTVGASFADERGEAERAEELYESCLEAYPMSATLLDTAMEFFDAKGRPERTTEILRGFLERAPHATAYRGRLARRLRSFGEVKEAEELLLEATRSEVPGLRAHAWSALTDHYIATEDLPAAVAAFESAIVYEGELSPKRKLAHADLLVAANLNERALEVAADLEDETLRDLVRARVNLTEGRPCEALELFEGAFPFWPNNAVARYYAARSAEQCDQFDKAIEHYRQSLRSGADATDAGMRLARMLVAEGRLEDSLFGIQQHLDTHPRDEETILLKTRVGLALGDTALLQEILRGLPSSQVRARAVVILAANAAADQGPEVAIQGLRADPRLDFTTPRDAPALDLLLELMAKAGRAQEARVALSEAIAKHPESAELYFVRARLLEREGAPAAEVQRVLERAAELGPSHAGTLLALGRRAASRGEIDSALSLLDRAYAADPADPTPAREAGQLLADAGRDQEAAARFEEVLIEFPQDAGTALALASLPSAQDRRNVLARRAQRFGGGEAAQRLLTAPQAALFP